MPGERASSAAVPAEEGVGEGEEMGAAAAEEKEMGAAAREFAKTRGWGRVQAVTQK